MTPEELRTQALTARSPETAILFDGSRESLEVLLLLGATGFSHEVTTDFPPRHTFKITVNGDTVQIWPGQWFYREGSYLVFFWGTQQPPHEMRIFVGH
jgi:hypothetical protein